MLKKLKPLIAGLLLGFLLSNCIAVAAENGYLLSLFQVKIFVNGEEKRPSDKEYQYFNGKTYVPATLIYKGTTYVPLRFFSEILGQKVEYNADRKAIFIGEIPENYLIVLDNDKLVGAVSDFIEYKKSQGYRVTYVVAGKINAKGANNAEKLKNYLVELDKKEDLEYVLFIGDPYDAAKANMDDTGGNIPMKYFYYASIHHNNEFVSDGLVMDENGEWKENGAVPTDLYYYTDLDWDADKDGFYGETSNDVSTRNRPEFRCLFKLGRIPFNDPETVRTILAGSMEKEAEYAEKKGPLDVLVAAGIYGYNPKTDGAFWAEKFREKLGSAGYRVTTMYEQEGDFRSKYSSTLPLTPGNFTKEWNKGYDMIYTAGIAGYKRYVWPSDTNGNGKLDDGNIIVEDFMILDQISGKNNGFIIMDGGATARMQKDRYAQNDPQLPKMLADGLVAAGVGRTIASLIRADEPAYSLIPYWSNKNTTCGANFHDAITEYFKSIPRDSYDFFQSLYTYNYFGDPSFKMK